MIDALRARLAGWLRARMDGLTAFMLAAEAGMGLALAVGLAQAVHGLTVGPLLLYAGEAIVIVRGLAGRPGTALTRIGILLLSGSVLTALKTAGVWRPLIRLAWRLTSAVSLRFRPSGLSADPAITELAEEIWAKLAAFAESISIWGRSLLSGRPQALETPTLLIWGLAVFALTAWAGWFLHFQRRPFLAVLPAVFALGFTVETVNAGYYYFAILAALSVLVIMVFSHAGRERAWDQAGYGYSEDLRLDLGWMAAAACVVVFVAAAFSPNISVKKILERIEEARQPAPEPAEIAPSLGLYEQRPEPGWPASAGSLPSSHLISDPPELLNTELFQVWVTELNAGGTRFNPYWRTHTYEVYTGHGWLAGGTTLQSYAPAERVLMEAPADKPTVQLRVRVQNESLSGVLIHTGQLVSASQPVEIMWREAPAAWQDYASGRIGSLEYSVRSAWLAPGIERLNAAGEDYPEWVEARYLALPESLPQRVIGLAEEFTADHPEPYARAEAIEAYLRQYPYNLDVPLPPLDQDIVDYFLVDLQEGYCDYYATAMVVLARLAGLPARAVGGYAPVVPDPESGIYQITGANAHTWVEIYFSGIGWIEFEPTAAQSLIDRPAAEFEPMAEMETSADEQDALVLPNLDQPWLWAALALVAPAAALFAWDRIRLRTRSHIQLLLLLRERVYRLARQNGMTRPQTATPNEITAAVRQAMLPRFSGRLTGRLARRGFETAADSAELLADAAYRGQRPEEFSRRQLILTLIHARRVSAGLWLAGVLDRGGEDMR